LLFFWCCHSRRIKGDFKKMTMGLQAEAISAFRSQAAAAALFPALHPMQGARERIGPAAVATADARSELSLAELTFRQLHTADEIAGIVHLRQEIQLVAASRADPTFVAREKKEMRRALLACSSVAAPWSGPFASFR
jgi:hypothetical protein